MFLVTNGLGLSFPVLLWEEVVSSVRELKLQALDHTIYSFQDFFEGSLVL